MVGRRRALRLLQSEQGEAMTKDEALKLALEALHGFIPYLPFNDEAQCGYYDKAITAIKEALAQPEQEKQFAKVFSQMKLENEPCSEVLALGQMMREWLQHQVSDNGSCVDTGKGFSEYDLWVISEGKELLITIKEKK